MARRRRCKGTTKAGKPCRSTSLIGEYCFSHQPKEVRDSHGFGGAQPGAGRPRLPRPHELLREKIEGDIEKWLAPLEDALEAERAIVVGSGESAEVEYVADHKIRLQASREAHDRVYGKAKQQLEIGGSETPLSAEIVAVDAREVADAAHQFLARLSGGTDSGG